MNKRQLEIKARVEIVARLFKIDPVWAVAIAMVESSLGENQVSRTGCKGIFQMSTIAMRDLLNSMAEIDDDLVDICCGVAFLRLLLKRWKTIEKATEHYCDPKDAYFYVERVKKYMGELA